MKKCFVIMMNLAVALILLSGFNSCCDDDETSKETNDKAGLFWLKNLTTDRGIGRRGTNQSNVYIEIKDTLVCHQGDTLVVSFTPDEKYKDYEFENKYILDSNKLVGENIYTKDLEIGIHTLSASAESKSNSGLTASYSFSFEVKKVKVSDLEAGTFLITNITTAETITKSPYSCYAGDTLKVVFQPKKEYASVCFDVKASLLNKLNDSLFVVPDLKTNLGGGISIGKNVDFQTVYNKNDSTLAAKREIGFFTNIEYADVTYTLDVSVDFLQFVNVSLEYTDERNNTVTVNLGDDDWIRDVGIIYEFQGPNGEKMTSSSNTPREGWTLVDQREFLIPYYQLDVHYDKLDKEYCVIARYSLKQNVVPTEESYKLRHSLKWGPADVAGAITNNISISIGDNSDVKKEDMASYLENLIQTPDLLKLYFDKRNRKVIEKK